jgi:hypothetical protein
MSDCTLNTSRAVGVVSARVLKMTLRATIHK